MSSNPKTNSAVPEPGGLRATAKRRNFERITSTATRMMLEEHFDDITTKRVAAEAGIGEATLFRYIKNKQELLTLVYGSQMDDVLDRIEREDAAWVAEHAGTELDSSYVIDRVLRVYRTRCDFYLINPYNATLYLKEGFESGGEVTARHIAQGDRTVHMVTNMLAEGQRAGVLLDSIDPSIVAQNCHGTYMHEIERTPVRKFPPATIWGRLEIRLENQLLPLATVQGTRSN